jgi:hypothetical protein
MRHDAVSDSDPRSDGGRSHGDAFAPAYQHARAATCSNSDAGTHRDTGADRHSCAVAHG